LHGLTRSMFDQIDVVIEQSIELAEGGRKAGMMSPKILMERIPNQIAPQLVDDPEESPFYKVFTEMPDTISDEDQARKTRRDCGLRPEAS